MLGKSIKIAVEEPETNQEEPETNQEESVREQENTETISVFPDFLHPFVRAANGGIYYEPPISYDKNGKPVKKNPVELTPFDLYPTQRIFSPLDGEGLMMRLILPKDGTREFLLPLKEVTSLEKLRASLSSNGVVYEPANAPRLASYLMKWSNYLMNIQRADTMHLQQGWTEGCKSFVLGHNEYFKNEVRNCPPSPLARNVVRTIRQKGSLEEWTKAINMLGDPGWEKHAFMFLCGLASPLMEFSDVNGITVSAISSSGTGKTGTIYAAISPWADPKAMTANDYTDNGGIQRMISLKNLPLCLDEQSNMGPKNTSDLVYKVSAGRGKIRMQASTNTERHQDYLTALICLISTNQALKQKIALYKADATAEEMRLVEISLNQPNVPGYEMTAERGRLMFQPLHENHGLAGPIFIQHVLNMPRSEFYHMFNEELARADAFFNAASEYRFISSLCACVYTAGQIGNSIGLFKFDLDRIRSVMEPEFQAIANAKTESSIRYLNLVNEFIAENTRSILVVRENGNISTSPTVGSLYIRSEPGKNRLFISSAAMKAYLMQRQINVKHFEDELISKQAMIGKIKKRMAKGWADGIEANIYAYEFEADKVGATIGEERQG